MTQASRSATSTLSHKNVVADIRYGNLRFWENALSMRSNDKGQAEEKEFQSDEYLPHTQQPFTTHEKQEQSCTLYTLFTSIPGRRLFTFWSRNVLDSQPQMVSGRTRRFQVSIFTLRNLGNFYLDRIISRLIVIKLTY